MLDNESEVCSIPEESNSFGKVKTVFVNVHFLKFGEVNFTTAKYHADVLLTSRWHLEDEQLLHKLKTAEHSIFVADNLNENQYKKAVDWQQVWNPKVTINNHLNEGSEITDSHEVIMDDAKTYWCVERKRFKGQFAETPDLAQYPFDIQDLPVTVVSEYSKDQVMLTEDPTKVHTLNKSNFTDAEQWYIYNFLQSYTIELCTDPLYPESQKEAIVVTAKVARRSISFLINHFLIFFLIASLTFTIIAVYDSEEIGMRLQLTFTLLLATVAHKFVVNQNLPKVSHFTYLDQYVLGCIILLAVISIWNAAYRSIHMLNNLDFIVYVVAAGCFLIFNLIFWIRIINGPFKKRKQLTKQEHIGMVEKFFKSSEIQRDYKFCA